MNGVGRNIEHKTKAFWGWIHCISFSLFTRLYKINQFNKINYLRFPFPPRFALISHLGSPFSSYDFSKILMHLSLIHISIMLFFIDLVVFALNRGFFGQGSLSGLIQSGSCRSYLVSIYDKSISLISILCCFCT